MAASGKYDYDFSDKSILIVEDTYISFKLIEAVMKQVKANIIHAKDGMMAIEAVESGKHFDLVMMDMQLPGMNGIEATKLIKKLQPELPVVATTANTYDENARACLDAGCDAFLSKPLKFREMFELMQSIFDQN